jgi:hypothetical protein
MARKAVLTQLLEREHVEEKKFYNGLTAEERQQQGKVDAWSAKDTIAHVAYWKRFRVEGIQEILQGGSMETFDNFDHENARIFEEFDGRPWNEIMAYAEGATAMLQSQLARMDEEELELEAPDCRPLWRIIIGNGYNHPLIHIAQYYQEKGDMSRAAELTDMLGEPLLPLDASPGWRGTVHYNAACAHALRGEKEQALAELAEALQLNDQLVEWSKEDPDLKSLHAEPAYQALYE